MKTLTVGFRIAAVSTLLLLASCASKPPIADVSAGMTAAQVRELMGDPADKSFDGSLERWIYPQSDGSQKVLTSEAAN